MLSKNMLKSGWFITACSFIALGCSSPISKGGLWVLISDIAKVNFRIDQGFSGTSVVSFPDGQSQGTLTGSEFRADVPLSENNTPDNPFLNRDKYSAVRFYGKKDTVTNRINGYYEAFTVQGTSDATGTFSAGWVDW